MLTTEAFTRTQQDDFGQAAASFDHDKIPVDTNIEVIQQSPFPDTLNEVKSCPKLQVWVLRCHGRSPTKAEGAMGSRQEEKRRMETEVLVMCAHNSGAYRDNKVP